MGGDTISGSAGPGDGTRRQLLSAAGGVAVASLQLGIGPTAVAVQKVWLPLLQVHSFRPGE